MPELLGFVDLVIAVVLLEGLALACHHQRTGRGLALPAFLPALVAGLALMLALRFLLAQGPGYGLLAWLGLAGLAHAADVWMRFRGSTGRPSLPPSHPSSSPE